jgi:dihydrofolate reductase
LILSGDAASEVEALKARDGGELILYGSADLANTLIEHELIDEYRLLVFPVVLGSGKHPDRHTPSAAGRDALL